MRVAILLNAVTDKSTPDEQDVIVQAESVSAALLQLGHTPELLSCDLDLASLRQRLENIQPDVVFNLVESLEGKGKLIHLVPSLLDVMGIPYTGSASESIYLSSHKVMAKEKMLSSNLPTPDWIGPYPSEHTSHCGLKSTSKRSKETIWIIKSVWEHASIGLDDNALITVENDNALTDHIKERYFHFGGACFAEQYIEGREFNLSLLAGPDGPEVLPPAEILFEGYPENKPRIVGYSAKWDDRSFDYHHTPRRFDFPHGDGPLLAKLEDMALRCWRLFGLGGYARVDFRVDNDKNPWILEVNTNPCLSPDAGFAAALNRLGMSIIHAVRRILDDAFRNRTKDSAGAVRPQSFDSVTLTSEKESTTSGVFFRYAVTPEDTQNVRQLTSATGFFSEPEVDVAVELVEERLAKGTASGYYFVFVDRENRLAGYACYGPIPCTVSGYDLYWIAVHPEFQKKGLGRTIFNETERLIREAGGTRIYADTSQKPQYDDTRAFYDRCGFDIAAVLEDFFDRGDGKVIYAKSIA
ncbi:MAG: GNAT family N-acetyltransferase [Proteobacteria bacterium]|nr:GNAT family N-acetyltransferase [Pseudomonadota bacterium]